MMRRAGTLPRVNPFVCFVVERPWQTDLVDASGAARIESGARSGDPRAPPADHCPAANGAEEAFGQWRITADAGGGKSQKIWGCASVGHTFLNCRRGFESTPRGRQWEIRQQRSSPRIAAGRLIRLKSQRKLADADCADFRAGPRSEISRRPALRLSVLATARGHALAPPPGARCR
jgi:hypothetical protein